MRRGYFYPRPPRGGRQLCIIRDGAGHLFLSTPSARRATYRSGNRRRTRRISIHALREEGDTKVMRYTLSLRRFLSTPSARRATPASGQIIQIFFLFLSTPSARRATAAVERPCQFAGYFYPRPPRGGRPLLPVHRCTLERISIHALREEGDGWRVGKNPMKN